MPSKTLLQMQGEVLVSGLVRDLVIGQWYDALGSGTMSAKTLLQLRGEFRFTYVQSVA